MVILALIVDNKCVSGGGYLCRSLEGLRSAHAQAWPLCHVNYAAADYFIRQVDANQVLFPPSIKIHLYTYCHTLPNALGRVLKQAVSNQ